MTGPDAFDQQLESWLVAEADAPAPTGLHERVLEPSTRQRPRPAWVAWLGSGWASEPPAGRLAAIGWARPVLVAVLILLMLGAAILVAGGPRQPSPSIGPLVYGRDGDIPSWPTWTARTPSSLRMARPRATGLGRGTR